MGKKKNFTWMQMGFTPGDLRMIERLDQISCHATSVWLRALMLLMQNDGGMTIKRLFSQLIGNHISKRTVRQILDETGDFSFNKEGTFVMISDDAWAKYLPNLERKFSHENAISCENSRTKSTSYTHAADNSTSDREEIEKEEENKKRGKETEGGDTLRLDEAQEREQLRAMERLRDQNYSPSEELLAKVPEQVKIHADKFWFPFACWLYDEQGMQRWQEAWAMHGSDAEFVDLVRRHWSETVTCFIEHAIIYGQFDKINSKNDIQCKLGLYLRPERMPARQLRAKLNAKELRQQATDPRELRFYDFMDQHCPHLVQMEQAMTYPQFDALRQQYGKERVLNVLRDMENDPKLHKRDCCATAKKWLERPPRSPQGGRTRS